MRDRGVAEASTVPLTSPPCPVGFIVLELTGQEDRDKDFLNGPLDGDDGDDTKDSMGGIPEFQEPLTMSSFNKHVGADNCIVLTKNSKNPTIPTSARKWASAAIYDPNFCHLVKIGPRSREVKKRARSTVAFQTMGPTATRTIRMSGLGGWFPSSSGKDLTNM